MSQYLKQASISADANRLISLMYNNDLNDCGIVHSNVHNSESKQMSNDRFRTLSKLLKNNTKLSQSSFTKNAIIAIDNIRTLCNENKAYNHTNIYISSNKRSSDDNSISFYSSPEQIIENVSYKLKFTTDHMIDDYMLRSIDRMTTFCKEDAVVLQEINMQMR